MATELENKTWYNVLNNICLKKSITIRVSYRIFGWGGKKFVGAVFHASWYLARVFSDCGKMRMRA